MSNSSLRSHRYSLTFDSMKITDTSKYNGVRRLTNSDSLTRNPYFPSKWKIYWQNYLEWHEYNQVISLLSPVLVWHRQPFAHQLAHLIIGRVHLAAGEDDREEARVLLHCRIAGVQGELRHHDPNQHRHRLTEGDSLQTCLPVTRLHAALPAVSVQNSFSVPLILSQGRTSGVSGQCQPSIIK